MNDKYKKKIVIISIAILCTTTAIFPVVAANFTRSDKTNDVIEPEMAIIQVGPGEHGEGGKVIKIPLSEAYRIKKRLSNLENSSWVLNESEYFKEMLTIFREENVFPPECTYENFVKVAHLLKEEIENKKLGKWLFSPSLFQDSEDNNKPLADGGQNQHVGFFTVWSSATIGGIFSYTLIFVSPYDTFPLFNITILDLLNLSAYWGYVAATAWLPGAPGYHVAISLLPMPGYEENRKIFWRLKSTVGMAIGTVSLGIYCYDENRRYPTPLFEAAVGFHLFDMMLGFPNGGI